MHSSRMRTAHSLTVSRSILGGGVCIQGGLGRHPPGCRPPPWMYTSWMRITLLLDAEPPPRMQTSPPLDADPFGCRPPLPRGQKE